jgi:hypothetical protein
LIFRKRFKVWVGQFLRVVIFTKDSTRTTKEMAGVGSFGRMAATMKVNGKMERDAVKASSCTHLVKLKKVIGLTVILKTIVGRVDKETRNQIDKQS